MGRKILATLAGGGTTMVLMMAIQGLSILFHPMPEGLDPSNREALADWVKTLPPTAFLMVLASYAVGCLAGGWVAARVAHGAKVPSLVVGGLFTIAGFANLAAIPHPLWFAVVSSLTYLPSAWLGATLARRAPAEDPAAK